MRKTIDQFMWGFQHYFRFHVGYEVRDVLDRVGLQTNDSVTVLLVGIAARDGLQHKICIEPEDGPLVVDDLQSIWGRTEAISEADPESEMFHSHPGVHANRMRSLFLRSRARAIAEALHKSGKFDGLEFFVSDSATVAAYEVHTCIGVPHDSLEPVPRFNNPLEDDYFGRHIEESFVEAVVHTCLHRADNALYLPDAGTGLQVLGGSYDIIRSSAERFVDGVSFALTSQPRGLFRLANEFSSLTYERSGAKGHLVVTGHDNLVNKLKVTFRDPVGLHESRSVRKILELTDATKSLLTDGSSIYGIGECNTAPDVAKIAIDGHAKWSLSVDDTTLMKVAYEHASLPKALLDKDVFRDILERTVGKAQVDRIWDVVQCALNNDHGTTIVISEDPASEVERLAQEGLPIKAEYLDHMDIARLGRVDGAIILGSDGRCYAFGMILDGLATTSGDRARGSRFNSSVRYQKTSEVGTMVIVISDDGTVDAVPSLKPRVWREEVEEAVQDFCGYSGLEGSKREEWVRRDRRVEHLKFYLDEEQCHRINEAFEREMDCRFDSDGMKLSRKRLEPDPRMNDSYFWE